MTELEKQYSMVKTAANNLRWSWANEIMDGDFRDTHFHINIAAKASALADLLVEMSNMIVTEQQQAQD